MAIFYTDLDNTLIYSYRHTLPKSKILVEVYKDKPLSFMTEKSFNLLQKLSSNIQIIPTTTRTIEQYNRIQLPFSPNYSLVCNGGILLNNGSMDLDWYNYSLSIIEDSNYAMNKAIELLTSDSRRYFEVRFINNLFVFTKCHEPNNVVSSLRERFTSEPVDVFNNGDKVYIVPTNLSKGNAIQRFNQLFNNDYSIGAGDSEFDIPMLKTVDLGLCPYGFTSSYKCNNKSLKEMDDTAIFSDSLLEYIFKNYLNK